MKKYDPENIRNVCLVGHKGSGKTSLGEAFLFDAKVTTRLGSVDAKTSTFDFEPEETARSMTIATSTGAIEWNKNKINLLDTPGDGNFIYDTRLAMTAADSAVLLVSAPDGVEVQTVRVWERAEELGLPRVVFINKMDRERADPDKTLEEIRSELSADVVAVQVPIGKEADFKGVVDVLSGQAFLFDKDGSGKIEKTDPPAELADVVAKTREALVEKIAESSDELLEKYLEAGELSAEEIAAGFSAATKRCVLFPAFFGSASHNMGVQLLLDFIAEHLPAPTERPAIKVFQGEEETELEPKEDGLPLALVIKTADAQGGTMSLFRVFSGTVSSDSQVYNASSETEERVGSLLSVTGKKTEQIAIAPAGDIAAVLKLKKTSTGDTLCGSKNAPLRFPSIQPPEPVISYAIKAKSKGDEDKLGSSLNRMRVEDPTLQVTRHQDTKDFLLSGTGAPHIEISVSRMKRRFGVEVTLETPRVPYRETITKKAQAQGRHKRQTGGRGQFGDVWLELSPQPRGSGFEFEERIKGGSVPSQFFPAVEKGVQEAMARGFLAGFPVVDIKCALYDGSFHEVDSSEMAFKRAASIGFQAAMDKAAPILLEPIQEMEIVVPEESMGDIMGDLNGRRGRVLGMESKNKRSTIRAQVPLAEILMYSPDLDSRTGGRGSFTMKFSHYQEAPHAVAQQVIAQYRPKKDEED
ncbi:MAG: elongation factor G [Deltaproteobacteria bacterium]|nr:elongation factor G [Deltaproteobacteria bacterium]